MRKAIYTLTCVDLSNKFLNACDKQILDAVVKDSKNAFYYSMITDGTSDVSHTE